MSIVTRFAPSPTGLLHLGHARAALFAWRLARARGGRFLLRLEDLDTTRCRPEFAAAILEDLAWLGLDWDGAVRVQSAHLETYRALLESLAARGLVYPCFCTRRAIQAEIAAAAAAPHGAPAAAPDGAPRYPGTCRLLEAHQRQARIDAGESYAVRLDMAAAIRLAGPLTFIDRGIEAGAEVICDPAPFGDVVLGRKDIPASYHLAVTHDDAYQGVTLVTRGEDLRAATSVQRLLQALFGWTAPEYRHHPLLTNRAGQRLSKRDGAMSLRALRAAGVSPASVRAMAGLSD
ncbi:MAG: tRNA glutamyl-Q(34) synthetase GluQRS [Acetobacteraceae bacterium]